MKSLSEWYQKYLGTEFGNNSYIDFKWVIKTKPGSTPAITVFSFFKDDSTYFDQSEKPYDQLQGT